MCNRARLRSEPETLHAHFGSNWAADAARPNRDPVELTPRTRPYVVREEKARRVLDVMSWDVLGGQAKWPMTNVRNLQLPQWRRLGAVVALTLLFYAIVIGPPLVPLFRR